MSKRLLLIGLIVVLLALSASVAFAQTNTPIPPTATPVGLTVDTNQFFTSTNTWITTFAPIVAIGIGISLALAILAFIGNQILRAFRGSGR